MKKHPLMAFVLPLATVVCLCALTNGCALQTSSESESHMRQIKIGMTLYRQDDTFISTIQKHFEAIVKSREASENVKIIVNILDGKGNQGVQNDQVDKFLSQGYDVICVNEVDRTAASVIIDKAKSADIPVVFFNREPVEEDLQRWEKVYYVGSDAREAGQMQGQVVVKTYQSSPQTVDRNGDGRLQYVMLEGEQGHQDALIRTEYSVKEVTNAGVEVEKLANETANWQRSQAAAIMSRWIEDLGDRIEVIFCNNDDMALGAIDAYSAAELDQLPVIVGIDTTPPALEAIKDRTLTGSVLNDSKGQAEAIFNIAYALATGLDPKESVPELDGRYVWVPQKIVTFANLPS
jgi:methyl-galactoside transport system substrate-binding protein